MKKSILVSFIVLLVLTLASCSKPQVTSDKKEITVAAAANLTNAFTELGEAFEKANNCKVIFSFGATGTLNEQIKNGAPFDVFAAADEITIEKLDKEGQLVTDTKQPYAVGRLGMAALKSSNIEVNTMEELLKPEIKKIAIANPETAPYGLAAKQVMEAAGLWDRLEPKFVYGKNISDTLVLVTTGNAEAGFISLSLKDDETLNFALIDSKLHEPIRQAIAVTKNAGDEEMGRKFIKFVMSTEGQGIMNKYGFETPEE